MLMFSSILIQFSFLLFCRQSDEIQRPTIEIYTKMSERRSDGGDSDARASVRRCSTCKVFIQSALKDSHTECMICRRCNEEYPCTIEADWTHEHWVSYELEKELKIKSRKEAKANKGVAKTNKSVVKAKDKRGRVGSSLGSDRDTSTLPLTSNTLGPSDSTINSAQVVQSLTVLQKGMSCLIELMGDKTKGKKRSRSQEDSMEDRSKGKKHPRGRDDSSFRPSSDALSSYDDRDVLSIDAGYEPWGESSDDSSSHQHSKDRRSKGMLDFNPSNTKRVDYRDCSPHNEYTNDKRSIDQAESSATTQSKNRDPDRQDFATGSSTSKTPADAEERGTRVRITPSSTTTQASGVQDHGTMSGSQSFRPGTQNVPGYQTGGTPYPGYFAGTPGFQPGNWYGPQQWGIPATDNQWSNLSGYTYYAPYQPPFGFPQNPMLGSFQGQAPGYAGSSQPNSARGGYGASTVSSLARDPAIDRDYQSQNVSESVTRAFTQQASSSHTASRCPESASQNSNPVSQVETQGPSVEQVCVPQDEAIGQYADLPEDQVSERLLAPKASASFFTEVLKAADMEVKHAAPPPVKSNLGIAARVEQRQIVTMPDIPLTEDIKTSMNKIQSEKQFKRFPWISASFPAPEEDRKFLRTPLCPEACYRQMSLDRNTRCTPEPTPPPGVEGGSVRRSEAPHRVVAWNRERDEDLRRLEALARDGIRMTNVMQLTFAYLASSFEEDGKDLSEEERKRAFMTLRDLHHVSGDHFIKIACQSEYMRRANVGKALNFSDKSSLLDAPHGSDLFGGSWPTILEEEEARRKRAQEASRKRWKDKLGGTGGGGKNGRGSQASRGGAGRGSFSQRGRGRSSFRPSGDRGNQQREPSHQRDRGRSAHRRGRRGSGGGRSKGRGRGRERQDPL